MKNREPQKDRESVGAQPKWQLITLLCIIGYEAAGALSGGVLLVLAPDGRLMDMQIEIMHGFFQDFQLPGLMLIGLGILNAAAFIAVLSRSRLNWILAAVALGGLVIWFVVEIIVLQGVHWLHLMWGLPVILGCFMIFLPVSLRKK
jgi:hypothetical protein